MSVLYCNDHPGHNLCYCLLLSWERLQNVWQNPDMKNQPGITDMNMRHPERLDLAKKTVYTLLTGLLELTLPIDNSCRKWSLLISKSSHSFLFAHGWKNDICLFLDRKSPQTTEGIWGDPRTPGNQGACSFSGPASTSVLTSASSCITIWVVRSTGYIPKVYFVLWIAVYLYSMITYSLWSFHV